MNVINNKINCLINILFYNKDIYIYIYNTINDNNK